MKILHRLRSLFRRRQLERDMSEEMRLHLELETQKNIAAGMEPNEAYYASKRRFGGVEQIKERCRDQRGWGKTGTAPMGAADKLAGVKPGPQQPKIRCVPLTSGNAGEYR